MGRGPPKAEWTLTRRSRRWQGRRAQRNRYALPFAPRAMKQPAADSQRSASVKWQWLMPGVCAEWIW